MKGSLDNEARANLRAAKLYCTRCRVAILKLLGRSGGPLSQVQIARKLGGGQYDKVTIYRTLESLVNAGLVHKAFVQERAWHFELSDNCTERQCHPHFTCTGCGETHCFTGISIPMAEHAPKGFRIQRQQVRLEGLCPSCA
ncbi:MAG: transcriptional repressor [Phycisphaerales bacterium]|nr:MAG: transcriptional repressor [Phycisphaerales bacterium]